MELFCSLIVCEVLFVLKNKVIDESKEIIEKHLRVKIYLLKLQKKWILKDRE